MAKQVDLLPTLPSREWGLTPFMEPRGFFGSSPFQLARRMQEDLDRMMSDFVPSTTAEPTIWAPSVDVIEEPQQWKIEVELPGVKKDDISVDVQDHQLTIKAEMKEETKEEKPQYYRRERRYGSFERRLALPENVKEDAIASTYNNGLLVCTIPKTEEAQKSARHVPVS